MLDGRKRHVQNKAVSDFSHGAVLVSKHGTHALKVHKYVEGNTIEIYITNKSRVKMVICRKTSSYQCLYTEMT